MRAQLLIKIRRFFELRNVMEVETPLLSSSTVTDPHIDAFSLDAGGGSELFLQTSPEYMMKRLLAGGSGAIFQICKAFRQGEHGASHNIEFTMLEWYRPNFNYHELMTEVEQFILALLGPLPSRKLTYRQLFVQYLGIDPYLSDIVEMQALAEANLELSFAHADRDTWLELLFSQLIEPKLVGEGITFVYDYPATQAALAKVAVDESGAEVGQRFELYLGDMELANGYFELDDATEQLRRFNADNEQRVAMGKLERPVDNKLIAAIKHGLPECSGVALGLDRLLMILADASKIDKVLSFTPEG
jgi:lysyl-tRNA synthetase class 2